LTDPNVPLIDRGAPWLDIAEAAGIELSKTMRFKPPGMRTIETKPVQIACRKDEGIINAVCGEEKELLQTQANSRYELCMIQLEIRPHSIHWRNVYFCDEFHFGIGPQITMRVKRPKGSKYRFAPMNVSP